MHNRCDYYYEWKHKTRVIVLMICRAKEMYTKGLEISERAIREATSTTTKEKERRYYSYCLDRLNLVISHDHQSFMCYY